MANSNFIDNIKTLGEIRSIWFGLHNQIDVDDNCRTRPFIERCYAYLRQTIIEKLDDKVHDDDLEPVIIDLPDEYLTYSENEILNPLQFRYDPANADKETTEVSYVEFDSDEYHIDYDETGRLVMSIHIDMFSPIFKPCFIRAMTHYLRLCRKQRNFSYYCPDDSDLAIRVLYDELDAMNPVNYVTDLYEAYCKAYWEFYGYGSDVKSVADTLTYQRIATEQDYSRLLEDLDNSDYTRDLIRIYLLNISGVVYTTSDYKLFNVPLHTGEVKEISKSLSALSDDDEMFENKLNEYVDSFVDNPELAYGITAFFKDNLNYFRYTYKNMFESTVFAANRDCSYTTQDNMAQMHFNMLDSLCMKNGQLTTELICSESDSDEEYIFGLSAKRDQRLFAKFNTLCNLVQDKFDLDFAFGFELRNTIKAFTGTLINGVGFPEINTIDDVRHAVEILNDID